MHWFAVLVGLSACYRPASDEPCTVQCGTAGACPDGLTCNRAIGRCALANGSCFSDAAPQDGSIDASDGGVITPPCAVPTNTMMASTTTMGTWFMSDRTRARAVKLSLNNDVLGTAPNPDTTNEGDYSSLFIDLPANMLIDAPRLSPDSNEIHVLMRIDSTHYIARSHFTPLATMWPLPSTLTMFEEDGQNRATFTAADAPSAPTTTVPRRMVVSRVSVLEEYEELMPGSVWQRLSSKTLTFGSVRFLGQALLSESGLRLVFRGQDGTAIVSAYYVDRATVTDDWPSTALKIPTGDLLSVATPFLTEDCDHFYYTDANTGRIHHVAL